MKIQPNAIITLNVRRLDQPLETMHPLLNSKFYIEFRNVPQDTENLGLVIYAGKTSHFPPVQCIPQRDGSWTCKCGSGFFPNVGEVKYELVCTDEDGETVPLGWGNVKIADFGSGTITPIPEHRRTIMEIPDDNGVMHRVKAVRDDAGEWTWQFID